MVANLRFAGAEDAATILGFIEALALYEREPDAVMCTADDLRRQLLEPRPPFECLLAEVDGQARGFALFFHNYSTWRGRPGLYLEDLFVLPEHRGQGLGKLLLSELAHIAVQRGCARMEWAVLDWNEPSIEFYRALGASRLDGWSTFRLSGEPLSELASSRRTDSASMVL